MMMKATILPTPVRKIPVKPVLRLAYPTYPETLNEAREIGTYH
ncbi:hypothetical protein BpJC7_22630 [Weizmannia acidilactici]|uniref:Uncharacterized protein n=1 Tax=Weizmannia acidilactici TaxID=2607726 RepID=A0A5J4JK23_9BACI|nr:hypothetical protein [Weizmannia acidilactici]GER68572.1 hypothetical protein BpJC4_30430 [Weizmannia acidilactici]GER70960.1 hypothetical protein BpJC7_22630 [Weizmannia acidilactici]GER75164.1 hypothetical protein BpPP18_32310 [Weizmannia acidilactici]